MFRPAPGVLRLVDVRRHRCRRLELQQLPQRGIVRYDRRWPTLPQHEHGEVGLPRHDNLGEELNEDFDLHIDLLQLLVRVVDAHANVDQERRHAKGLAVVSEEVDEALEHAPPGALDDLDDELLLGVHVAHIPARLDVGSGLLDELLHARFDRLPVGPNDLLAMSTVCNRQTRKHISKYVHPEMRKRATRTCNFGVGNLGAASVFIDMGIHSSGGIVLPELRKWWRSFASECGALREESEESECADEDEEVEAVEREAFDEEAMGEALPFDGGSLSRSLRVGTRV